ncbi:hypothetical protein Y032_0131g1606 [Ancylostoma ceylanicum]|uniref:Uncharacterized protein n=1 Tax=Ancylostoma ceylanicum TaxID=53326 RepID=A0A016T6Y8_9BILA|nr:hypothetical protein Y032_0131g1606 [Ancylostoma ceylanicum]
MWWLTSRLGGVFVLGGWVAPLSCVVHGLVRIFIRATCTWWCNGRTLSEKERGKARHVTFGPAELSENSRAILPLGELKPGEKSRARAPLGAPPPGKSETTPSHAGKIREGQSNQDYNTKWLLYSCSALLKTPPCNVSARL